MITVPPSFRAEPRWWNDHHGAAWLDRLPDLVAERCRRWSLSVDGEPLHGSNALVVPVRKGDRRLALRLAPPTDDIEPSAAALRFWNGRGTVRLYDLDVASGAMLLERLDSTRSLQQQPLAEAVPIIGRLTLELHVPVHGPVPSTATLAAAEADGFERGWSAAGRPTPRSQLTTSVGSAEALAAAPTSERAVDGDLHCEQVLAAERAPWLVVDPVLLRGDPEYDLARVLWSRLDEIPTDTEIERLVAIFVQTVGVPAHRARSWIVVRSMSYLLWGLAHGLTWDPPRCRRLLDLFC